MPAELVFADEVEGVPVTVIPYNFSYYFKSDKDKLTKITLPDSVKTYGYAAFYGCTGLTKAVLPDALEIIEEGAFTATDMLTEIHLPANVKEIGAGALATNYLADAGNYKIYLVESENPDRYDSETRLSAITADAQNPYFTAKDGVLVIPNGVTDIGGVSVVNNQKITPIEFPESVKSISSFTALPKLTSVIIRSDDCEITDGAFGSPMGWDPDTDKPFYTYNPDCTIYCNADSTAATYAKEKGFQTAPLPEKVTVPETTTTTTTTSKTTTSTTTNTTSTSAAQPTTTTVTTTTTTAAVSTTADTTTSASVTGT